MKIVVYAISKNESQFVNRWYNSVKEADEIYVLDTGSTDDTVKLLRDSGVHVSIREISPWRFDVARNKSLELVPEDTDICVCLDLDEVIEPGWRTILEELWDDNTNRLKYNYNWHFDANNNPDVNFYIEKIHDRHNYTWIHPVHEVLKYTNNHSEKIITTDLLTINHYPDVNKSRSNYLPLLELSVSEDPLNDRNMHYLGREYMYYEKWNEAIDTLIKHLNLPSSLWKDERSASMRFISRCYQQLNRYEEAIMWLDNAMKETPYLRDPFIERALLAYSLNNYKDVHKYSLKALKIKQHEKTYINEIFSWDNTVYDLLSLSSYYYKNSPKRAIYYNKLALKMDPTNERLLNNMKILKEIQ